MRFPFLTDPLSRLRGRLPLAGRAVLLAAALVAAVAACAPRGLPVRVVIPPGSSFKTATDSLAKAGVIATPQLFRLYAKVKRQDRQVKPGAYRLRPGTSWNEILQALIEGKVDVKTVVIPEGWQLDDIVPQLARTLTLSTDSVEAAVRDTALLRRLNIPTSTVEGYVFPATYTFPDGITARDAVAAMVRRFEAAWKPEWDQRLQELAMSRHDVVTLASIVETEARLAEERPVIAAVYHNRLRKGMRLQADPTVQYARGEHTNRVLYKDLEIESPYNTYRHAGLPPGPIASPGAASLEATLFPANVPYLFFVAHPDGHHEFTVDFDGHRRARQALRRQARRNR